MLTFSTKKKMLMFYKRRVSYLARSLCITEYNNKQWLMLLSQQKKTKNCIEQNTRLNKIKLSSTIVQIKEYIKIKIK
jgi:hypothetical protein